jgi:hypothetical protein
MTGLARLELILFVVLFSLTGCFRNPRSDTYEEFRTLMDNQFSASGSDLTFAACGWPVSKKMKLKDIKLDIFPDSTSENGRGYAEISADGENFKCGGKLFFIYNYSYTGGHGYSGGTSLRLEIIQRESAVDEKISNPESAVTIETGKKIEGEITASDAHLPDNSPADFYVIDLKGNNPGIKFKELKGDGISLKGAVYQNKMFVSTLSESGMKLKPGRITVLITSEGKTGRYSFKIEELSEEEKSNLK